MTELDFENQLHSIAGQMDYPRTPDVAGFVTARLRYSHRPRFSSKALAWSLTVIFVLFSSLMLIPPARAAILEFIQIGIVRIFPRPTEVPTEIPGTLTPESMAPSTATPYLDRLPVLSDLSQIAGPRSFAQAQNLVASHYAILLPAYPADLGEPDLVFVQDADGSMTILVWLDPNDPEKVLLSLHFIPEGSWAIHKSEPVVLEQASVNGERAFWAVGPYPLRLSNGNLDFTRLIQGHVLIWAADDITYRLETALPLEEAVNIAESLQPIP